MRRRTIAMQGDHPGPAGHRFRQLQKQAKAPDCFALVPTEPHLQPALQGGRIESTPPRRHDPNNMQWYRLPGQLENVLQPVATRLDNRIQQEKPRMACSLDDNWRNGSAASKKCSIIAATSSSATSAANTGKPESSSRRVTGSGRLPESTAASVSSTDTPPAVSAKASTKPKVNARSAASSPADAAASGSSSCVRVPPHSGSRQVSSDDR